MSEPRRSRRGIALRAVQPRRGDALPEHGAALARPRTSRGAGGRRWWTEASQSGRRSCCSTSCQPQARRAHRRASERGAFCCIATTTPYDLVKPLADLLGFDDVALTAMAWRTTAPTTGRSSATSCGPTASSPPCASGPTSTVSIWRAATSTPTASTTRRLLSVVGHPFAVNPDLGLRLLSRRHARWPTLPPRRA